MPKPRNDVKKQANPAPLGLMGFGMTTVLLSVVNAGLLSLAGTDNSIVVIIAMGIFYGGLAQLIAGIMEFKNGNTFGTVAFCSYGLFWLSLVAIWVLPLMGLTAAASSVSVGAYLLMWGIFTAYMFIGTLNKSRALQVVFLSLAVLFFILATADITGIAIIKTIGGIEGIFCGASAMYLACAEVLNEAYGKKVLPI